MFSCCYWLMVSTHKCTNTHTHLGCSFFPTLLIVQPTLLYIQSPVNVSPLGQQDVCLLCWFYWQIKSCIATHCIRVYNIMLFTGALSWVSERDTRLMEKEFGIRILSSWADRPGRVCIWETLTLKTETDDFAGYCTDKAKSAENFSHEDKMVWKWKKFLINSGFKLYLFTLC